MDNFIIHRKVRYPELIFNQNRAKDKLFEVDAAQNWALADNGGCFIC